MPMLPAPKPEANIKTKPVTPPGWDTKGAKAEYFTILTYTDPSVVLAAQKAARETSANGTGRVAEEQNRAVYCHHLFAAQLTGWRVLVDPSVPPNPDTMYEEGGYLFWQFTPANVADMPWDLRDWLEEQIRGCGGALATSALVTKADDGTLLDFRRSGERVGHGATAPA